MKMHLDKIEKVEQVSQKNEMLFTFVRSLQLLALADGMAEEEVEVGDVLLQLGNFWFRIDGKLEEDVGPFLSSTLVFGCKKEKKYRWEWDDADYDTRY